MMYHVYSSYFGGSSFGEAAKTDSGKKIKLLYNIRGHASATGRRWGSIYLSVNR
jgi:hypothetical protein